MILNWDQYFMGVATLSGMRSKDPNTQVGACIVNDKRRIVGIGYNGFPVGCNDNDFPWGNSGEYLNTKYPYVVHAEANAILNSTTTLENCTLYVNLFPCNECAKLIIQSGIKQIVYGADKYEHLDSTRASKRMLKSAGVTTRIMADVSIGITAC